MQTRLYKEIILFQAVPQPQLHQVHYGIDAIEKDNGQVTVTLRKNVNDIKIQIQDNGKGIPRKDWRNVFRRTES